MKENKQIEEIIKACQNSRAYVRESLRTWSRIDYELELMKIGMGERSPLEEAILNRCDK